MKNLLRLFLATLLHTTIASATDFSLTPPAGYEVQRLPGLNGEILKPMGWYFTSNGTKNSIIYRLTREDPTHGYLTGFTITVAPSVYKITNKKPSEYAQVVMSDYAKKTLISTDDARTFSSGQGEAQLLGCIVDEKISYMGKEVMCRVGVTTMAIDDIDLLAVIIFGTPVQDWKANEKIYRTVCERIILVGTNPGESP